MSMEKLTALLDAVRTDPRAKELLKDAAEPKSEEEMIRLCADIAPKLGFDITEDEIRAGIAEMVRERMEKTAADMEKLPEDELKNAAGGACWTGDEAPDGHEMGCLIAYHGWQWSHDNDIWCRESYWCYRLIKYKNYTCTGQMHGCKEEVRI